MFSRLATLLPVAALVAVAAAAPSSSGSTTCSTGYQSCCNTSQYTSTFGLASGGGSILSLLNGLGLGLGLTCDPVTVVGAVTGSSCTQQTVCCTDTSSTSLVNFSCNNLSL